MSKYHFNIIKSIKISSNKYNKYQNELYSNYI